MKIKFIRLSEYENFVYQKIINKLNGEFVPERNFRASFNLIFQIIKKLPKAIFFFEFKKIYFFSTIVYYVFYSGFRVEKIKNEKWIFYLIDFKPDENINRIFINIFWNKFKEISKIFLFIKCKDFLLQLKWKIWFVIFKNNN